MITYLVTVIVALAILWGAHAFWRRGIEAEVSEGAAAEYARLRRVEPALIEGMDEQGFRRVYARVETPRFPTYLLGAVTAFLIGTPILLALMTGIAYYADALGLIARPAAAANSLQFGEGGAATVARRVSPEALQYILQGWAGFYYFFGLLFFWISVVFVSMRRYHARTPGFLREEVLRSR